MAASGDDDFDTPTDFSESRLQITGAPQAERDIELFCQVVIATVYSNEVATLLSQLGGTEYRDDPKRPDTYVYVGLDIKGLKKNFTGKAASNADIKLEMEDGEPNSQWFAVTVNLHFKDGKTKKFRYHVKRLPAAVVTDRKKSYFRVRKDNVDIYLQKAVNGRWASTLDSIGLDQAPN